MHVQRQISVLKAQEDIKSKVQQELGDLPMQNVVPKLSETPGAVRWVGPALGEHTREILSDVLGKSDDEIAALAAAGII